MRVAASVSRRVYLASELRAHITPLSDDTIKAGGDSKRVRAWLLGFLGNGFGAGRGVAVVGRSSRNAGS